MAKNGRFMVGLVGVAAVVTYLIWTGVNDTMVYYLTPAEYAAKIDADPTFKDIGVKVSGRVVPGTHEEFPGQLLHRFVIHDLDNPDVTMTIEYDNVLPDTFSDSESMVVDAVIEGRLREDGIFVATSVLTKCGSRYEATPEQLAG